MTIQEFADKYKGIKLIGDWYGGWYKECYRIPTGITDDYEYFEATTEEGAIDMCRFDQDTIWLVVYDWDKELESL